MAATGSGRTPGPELAAAKIAAADQAGAGEAGSAATAPLEHGAYRGRTEAAGCRSDLPPTWIGASQCRLIHHLPMIRDQRSRPGEMVHLDTKKSARVEKVGRRILVEEEL